MSNRDLSTICGGMKFGHLTVIQKVADNPRPSSPNLKRRVRVECVCGKRETIPTYYLIRSNNPKTNCGCQRKTIKTHNAREFRIWHMMHVRCYNKNHEAWKHYGGRGIGVCAEWHKDNPDGKGFERFLNFVGRAPSMAYSIDRVDNDMGYQPYQADGITRQVRWATSKEQRANQRPYKPFQPADPNAS